MWAPPPRGVLHTAGSQSFPSVRWGRPLGPRLLGMWPCTVRSNRSRTAFVAGSVLSVSVSGGGPGVAMDAVRRAARRHSALTIKRRSSPSRRHSSSRTGVTLDGPAVVAVSAAIVDPSGDTGSVEIGTERPSACSIRAVGCWIVRTMSSSRGGVIDADAGPGHESAENRDIHPTAASPGSRRDRCHESGCLPGWPAHEPADFTHT